MVHKCLTEPNKAGPKNEDDQPLSVRFCSKTILQGTDTLKLSLSLLQTAGYLFTVYLMDQEVGQKEMQCNIQPKLVKYSHKLSLNQNFSRPCLFSVHQH